MKYRVEQELELAADLVSYADDPLGFVLYAYPWGQRGTPLADWHGPRKWQAELLEEIGAHTRQQGFALDNDLDLSVYRAAVASGRGIGKSALFAWLSHWHASTHLGSSTILTANTEAQLRTKTFPEFGRWFGMAMNHHWFEVDSLRIYPKDWIANLVQDQLKISPGYWYIQGQNWSAENVDAFAGTHNPLGLAVLYDEASGIEEGIWRVTAGFFTERTPYRYFMAFSNPRRNSGAFFNRFNKPELAATWRTRKIDARDVEGADQSVYQAIMAEHGPDSDTARVEVYGEFPEASEDQFITNSAVRGAQQREVLSFDDTEPLILGVDPAPRGRTVLRARQGRDARSIKPIVLNGKDNHEIADAVVAFIEKYDPDAIAVDGGMGTGVIDELKRRRVKVFEVWFGTAAEDAAGEFATRGSELWGKLRDWLPGGCIDASETLFRDLTSRTWKFHGREDGKKILRSKKEMAKDGIPSPDDGDALALTFAPQVPRRTKRSVRNASVGGVRVAAGVGECTFG